MATCKKHIFLNISVVYAPFCFKLGMVVAYSLIQHMLEALSNIAIYRDIAQYRVYHDFFFCS